ncbi:MAG: AtpZ/AtpI family protein [Candidatus Binataceae bacterium]
MEPSRPKMLRYGLIALNSLTPIVAGPVVGHYLDVYFKTGSWLTAAGFVLGLATGFYNLFREANAIAREMKG